MTATSILYTGEGIDKACLDNLEDSLITLLGRPQYQEGIIKIDDPSYLDKRVGDCKAIIFGGGNAAFIFNAILKAGSISYLKNFIQHEEKGYYGECAGAYLVSEFFHNSQHYWDDFIADSSKHLTIYHTAVGPALSPVKPTITSISWNGKTYHDYWHGGPVFRGLAKAEDSIYTCPSLIQNLDSVRNQTKHMSQLIIGHNLPFGHSPPVHPKDWEVIARYQAPTGVAKIDGKERTNEPAIIARGSKVLNALHTSFNDQERLKKMGKDSNTNVNDIKLLERDNHVRKQLFRDLMTRAKVTNAP